MNTKDFLKWVLIAAGAYLVYSYLRQNGYLDSIFGSVTGETPVVQPKEQLALAPPSGAEISTQPTGASPTVQQPKKETPITTGTTKEQIVALSQNDAFIWGPQASASGEGNGKAGYYRWSFYYSQTASGKTAPVPDPASIGVDPNVPITLDEWWTLVSQHGVSGLDFSGSGYPIWSGRWGMA